MMELLNHLTRAPNTPAARAIVQEGLEAVILMLSPIVPHVTQTLWEMLGQQGLLLDAPWPTFDPQALVREEIKMVIQVNGKVRGHLMISPKADHQTIEEQALQEPNIQRFIAEKTVKKVIVVPNKLVNVVIA